MVSHRTKSPALAAIWVAAASLIALIFSMYAGTTVHTVTGLASPYVYAVAYGGMFGSLCGATAMRGWPFALGFGLVLIGTSFYFVRAEILLVFYDDDPLASVTSVVAGVLAASARAPAVRRRTTP